MDIYSLVGERFPALCIEKNFSFARHTTIGCGGVAEVCLYPGSAMELCDVLGFLDERNIAVCFLGAGANVLPADGRFCGAVIRFSRMNAIRAEGDTIVAGAGVTGGTLLRAAASCELSGLHFLTGIPMTVGGAVAMNAGVADRHISDVLLWAEGVENGRIRRFSRSECLFAEKTSIFQKKIPVTRACFAGEPSSAQRIAEERARYRARRSRLPKGRSMGCVFVNPPEGSAGAIIDECGLKGMRLGGARVSELHANFILCEGATASDVARLIAFVRGEVYQKTGILLREEIKRIP